MTLYLPNLGGTSLFPSHSGPASCIFQPILLWNLRFIVVRCLNLSNVPLLSTREHTQLALGNDYFRSLCHKGSNQINLEENPFF